MCASRSVSPLAVRIGSEIRRARIARGVTTTELAEGIGMRAGDLREIELGLRPNVSLALLPDVARALGATLEVTLDTREGVRDGGA